MPEGFITKQGGGSTKMTLIGWAADGFPIYARYGYSTANNASSALKSMKGSYQLVSTVRIGSMLQAPVIWMNVTDVSA